jgi:hypothetical protein
MRKIHPHKNRKVRESKKEDGFFDGRFVPRKEDDPQLYLDEADHIESQMDNNEEPEFEIELSDHRMG